MDADTVTLRMETQDSAHVLVAHLKEVKRLECYLRLATAFLLLALAAVLFLASGQRSPAAQHADPPVSPQMGLLQAQRGSKAAAHLISNGTFHWEHRDSEALLNGFRFEEDSLIVPQEGLYYIYLQLTYRMPENKSCTGVLPLRPSVYMWRDSYGDNETLLASDASLDCQAGYEVPVFLAGLFSLEKEAKLMVSYGTTDTRLISKQNKRLCFGAFLI